MGLNVAQGPRQISEEHQIMRQMESYTQAVRAGAREEGPEGQWGGLSVFICEQLVYNPYPTPPSTGFLDS